MGDTAKTAPPGRLERMLLAAVAALLALALFWLRGGLHPEAALDRLARQSPELTQALADGKPTLVEFYADWCEACRAMAPAMEAMERRHHGELDVVLLNVDNPRWQPQVDRYGVNGIPHLELFDARGERLGQAIGARSADELDALAAATLEGGPLPALAGMAPTSALDQDAPIVRETPIAPRSHG
ncbi:MAG: redoxin domain-containing protein [Cyanobacteria bacterium K_Offshore_surface_m2_239]|nr:redoxin domain-containing protein [Cyanobacteria bacterium K_Offshore_surface_m2_239]